jgi:hypothetical protein
VICRALHARAPAAGLPRPAAWPRPSRWLARWLAGLALALLACRGAPSQTVERLAVDDSPGMARLESVGVGQDEVRDAAQKVFDAAPGFVRSADARASTRRYAAQVNVERADGIAAPAKGQAVAQVVVSIELAPVGNGTALREAGRAAEPVGGQPGALRIALQRAADHALQRAVTSLALRLSAERKSNAELVKDLSAQDAKVRVQAVQALADRGDHQAVPALITCLGDADPEIAERAVGALAQLRDPRAVPALIALTRHRDVTYLASAAHILGDIGGDDAQAWLLTMAFGHPDEVVRGAAREALSEMAARAPAAASGP